MFGITGIIGGIALVILGFFLFFVLPGPTVYQTESFSMVYIVIGLVLMILGGILIFG